MSYGRPGHLQAYRRSRLGVDLTGAFTSVGGASAGTGAAVGSVIPGVGTAIGAGIGTVVGLLGPHLAPIQPASIPVATPSGTLTYNYTGRAEAATQSIGYIFGQWAAAGHLNWLSQIASTGSGPKWSDPSTTFSGYGNYDRSFAAALVQAYANAPSATGTIAGLVSQLLNTAPSNAAPVAPGSSPIMPTTPAPASVAGVPLSTPVVLAAAVVAFLAFRPKTRGRRR